MDGSAPVVVSTHDPLVFVGSSTEMAHMATAVKMVLEKEKGLDVRHWEFVIKPGRTVIEGLMSALDTYDFGIFLLTKDDILTIRDKTRSAPRDNVILELGLFTGRLGRDRTFILTPTDGEDLRLPTDLLGVVAGQYNPVDPDAAQDARASAVQVAAEGAREEMLRLGVRPRLEAAARPVSPTVDLETYSPPGDPWIAAFQAGALEAIEPERVLTEIMWVVDPVHGVGRVIELDRSSETAELTVEYRNGRRAKRSWRVLREARFRLSKGVAGNPS